MKNELLKQIKDKAVEITQINENSQYSVTTHNNEGKQTVDETPLQASKGLAEAIIHLIDGRRAEEWPLLTVEQIQDLGHLQRNIIVDLQLIQTALSHIEISNNKMADDTIMLVHRKIQQAIKELDESTFIIMNINNRAELIDLGIISEVEENE